MNRIVVFSLGMLSLVACAEDPTAVAPSYEVQFSSDVSSSSHTLVRPSVTGFASGSDIVLSIDGDWTALIGGGSNDATFGHFELYRDGLKIADVKPANGFVDMDLEDGTYTYTVRSMSRTGTGRSTMTYHSAMSDSVEVTVGSVVYSIDASTLGGNCGNGQANGNMNLTFQLLGNDVVVTDEMALVDGNLPSDGEFSFDTLTSTYTSNTKLRDQAYTFEIALDGVLLLSHACNAGASAS